MPLRASFVPTEKAIACAMGAEVGQKWPQRRRQYPNSNEGAPNGQSRFKQHAVDVERCGAVDPGVGLDQPRFFVDPEREIGARSL
ncbi:MAG: hypothetical protein WEK74_12855 [Hydrogenophaga sp.]